MLRVVLPLLLAAGGSGRAVYIPELDATYFPEEDGYKGIPWQISCADAIAAFAERDLAFVAADPVTLEIGTWVGPRWCRTSPHPVYEAFSAEKLDGNFRLLCRNGKFVGMSVTTPRTTLLASYLQQTAGVVREKRVVRAPFSGDEDWVWVAEWKEPGRSGFRLRPADEWVWFAPRGDAERYGRLRAGIVEYVVLAGTEDQRLRARACPAK